MAISYAFSVEAYPSEDGTGWVALYRLPGLTKRYVKDKAAFITENVTDTRGVKTVFESQDQALASAGIALAARLNDRVMAKNMTYDYERLRPVDFARLLGEINISPTDFAWMHGAQYDRVMKWIDGAEDLPPWLRPVMAAYQVPAALDAAWAEAELATTRRLRKPKTVDPE